ncbi:MAG: VWA domain-containing protein [Bacteroidota bacterium]|nr:VWA domain-containing protein [Bacteroidota bacterium]
MNNISFINPEFFWFLLIIPLLVFGYVFTYKKHLPTLTMSSIEGFQGVKSIKVRLRHGLFVLKLLALTALIVAIARPVSVSTYSRTKSTHGVDIILSVDVSASMLARDLKPNRLESLKKVAAEFTMKRPQDRIGLVVYSAESYTKTPITTDKNIVLRAIRDIRYDNILEDGTAIGMGLATAVNRLKESKAKSKVIILMTDGENNSGFLEPRTAAEIAKQYDIKVYTIGIGSNGFAETPYAKMLDEFLYKMVKVKIDEDLMKDIAQITGGKYFRATNNKDLSKIYEEIDKLEKTEIEELSYSIYDEKYRFFIFLALIFILLEFVLRRTIFRGFI